MQDQTTLSKLSEKVSEIVDRYKFLKQENDVLRIEVVKLKAESEAKSKEIEKLFDENSLKDLEIEEIVQKIESLMV